MKVKPTITNLPLPQPPSPSPQPPPLMTTLTTFLIPLLIVTITMIPFSTSLLISDDDFVSRRCKEAAAGDPNFTYDFCLQTLEHANPNIHKVVTTMDELVGVSMNLTVKNATRIIKRISSMLNNRGGGGRSKLDPYCRRALGDCYELYSDAKGELKDASKDVFGYRDYFKANVEVSAAMDSSTTCEDGFRERRKRWEEGGPLAAENEVFFRLTAVLLSFINMLHYN